MCFLAQYDYFLFVFIQRTDVYIIIMIICLLMAMLGNGIEIKCR